MHNFFRGERSRFARLAFSAGVGLLTIQSAMAAQTGTPTLEPPAVTTPLTGEPVSLSVWAGYGNTEHFNGGYIGAMAPLNGNLVLDGFAIRGDVSLGQYDYSATLFPSLHNVSTQSADLMLGYLAHLGAARLSGFGGVTVENHDNPDPTAIVRGTKIGGKAVLGLDSPIFGALRFSGVGSYASPFSTYFVMGRLSLRLSNVVSVGPLVSTYGNGDSNYREDRYGGEVGFNAGAVDISLNGGVLRALRSGDDGYFVGINLGRSFH